MKNYCPICQMYAWEKNTFSCDYCHRPLIEPPKKPEGWPFPDKSILKKDEEK